MGDKVWVIRPATKKEKTETAGNLGESSGSKRMERSMTAGSLDSRGQSYAEADRVKEEGSPAFTVLAYLLGPLAVLATWRGRQSRFWVSAAIGSCALLTFILLQANAILPRPQGPRIAFFSWTIIACIAIFAGFATWARGVFLLDRHKGWLLSNLPASVRHPGTGVILGLMIPGLGLFVAEHARRAVCALWTICAAVISLFLLLHASELWQWNRLAGPFALPPDTLERFFLALGAVVLFGALVWIIQALDGARLAGPRSQSDNRPQGDLVAIMLLIAIATFSVKFEPADLAKTLDRFAVSTRLDGLEVIPLLASSAAMRLDPSQPRYVVTAIEINKELGRADVVRSMRQELEERWRPYERMLLRYGSLYGDDGFPSMAPIAPAPGTPTAEPDSGPSTQAK